MQFKVIGKVANIETISASSTIRELPRLNKFMEKAAGENLRELPRFDLPMVVFIKPKSTGMRHMALGIGN